jgi:hypothetical protein
MDPTPRPTTAPIPDEPVAESYAYLFGMAAFVAPCSGRCTDRYVSPSHPEPDEIPIRLSA